MTYNPSKDLILSPHNDSSHQASTKLIDIDASVNMYGYGNSSQDYPVERHVSLKTSESKTKMPNTPHNIRINSKPENQSKQPINCIPETSFNSLSINDLNRQSKNASTGSPSNNKPFPKTCIPGKRRDIVKPETALSDYGTNRPAYMCLKVQDFS
jgi:hypothetical protein